MSEVADTVSGSRVVFAEGGGLDTRTYRVDFSELARTFPDLRLTGSVPACVQELLTAFAAVRADRAGRPRGAVHPAATHPQPQEAGRIDASLRLDSLTEKVR